MSIPKPNYTQTPNAVFDLLPQMTEAELRVTLAICRETFGWHRPECELSISALEKATGLSRQGVIKGVKSGMKRGTLLRRPNGSGFLYSLAVNEVDTPPVHEVDTPAPEGAASQLSRLPLVNLVDQQVVNLVDHNKRKDKETTTKKGAGGTRARAVARPAPAPSPAPALDGEVRQALEHAGVVLTAEDSATAAAWAQLVPLSWQLDAIQRAQAAGKPFVKYIDAIVQRLHAEGKPGAPAGSTPAPAALTEQPPADDSLVQAIARAVGYDARTLPRRKRDELHATAATLAAAGYTAADVDRFRPDVWEREWQWRKERSLPTLGQLAELIGRLRMEAHEHTTGTSDEDIGPTLSPEDEEVREQLRALKRAAREAARAEAAANGAGLPNLPGPGLGAAGPATRSAGVWPPRALPVPGPGGRGAAGGQLAAD